MKNVITEKNRVHEGALRLLALIFAVFFVFSTAVTASAASVGDAYASEIGIETSHIKGAYLYNIENDFTVLAYAADDTVYPTSTVKIMSGILVIEQLSSRMSEQVTVTAEMLDGVGGNTLTPSLKEGEIISIRDLLYAMLVGGANDAAHVLAVTVAGSVEAFVDMMNVRAAELGAVGTHYTNPSGIHDSEMYTTVSDTAKIALHAYSLPNFMEITSTTKYVIDETNLSEYRNVYNRNYLLSTSSVMKYFYTDAAGMNAGSTSLGGSCVVTTAQRDGLTYLAIVMGADTDEDNDIVYSYTECKKLLDYAFSSYGNIELVKEGEIICEIPVTLSGTTDYVTLVTKESMSMYLPTSTDLETEITRSYKTSFDSIEAPVAAGEVAGVMTVMYNGEIVGNIELITTVAVARSEFLYTLEQIKSFGTSRFFIATIIAAFVLTVLYVVFKAIYLHRKKTRRIWRSR